MYFVAQFVLFTSLVMLYVLCRLIVHTVCGSSNDCDFSIASRLEYPSFSCYTTPYCLFKTALKTHYFQLAYGT